MLKNQKQEQIIEQLKEQLILSKQETLGKLKAVTEKLLIEKEESDNTLLKVTQLYKEEEKKNKELVD